jgi:hypothetical protein
MADAPRSERDVSDRQVIWLRWKQEYFLKPDWTGQINLKLLQKVAFRRNAAAVTTLLLNRQGLAARFSRSELMDRREQNRIEGVGILDLRNVPDILNQPKRRRRNKGSQIVRLGKWRDIIVIAPDHHDRDLDPGDFTARSAQGDAVGAGEIEQPVGNMRRRAGDTHRRLENIDGLVVGRLLPVDQLGSPAEFERAANMLLKRGYAS